MRFLGIAGKISEKDINADIVKQVKLLFLKYLWDLGDPQKALNKAIKNSAISAMSLSDLFVLKDKNFFRLVQNKLNITFANEQEMMALIGTSNFNDVIEFAKKKKLVVVTRGKSGAVAIQNHEVSSVMQ